MRYTKALDIWALNDTQRQALPVGQWVYAGEPSNKGQFLGQGRTTVVAWRGNGKPRWASYRATLNQYAKTVRN